MEKLGPQEVRNACILALKEAGFTQFRKDNVDRDLGNGFRCWVGLNSAKSGDVVEVNPFVGVHVVPIEKLWTSLKRGRYPGKYDRGVATVAVHMGQLKPDERVFRFDRRTDLISESRRLARLYTDVGVPFAQSIATYADLLPVLQRQVETLGAYPERVACCLMLMDRKDEALTFAQEFASRYQEYFEGFATPFIERFAH